MAGISAHLGDQSQNFNVVYYKIEGQLGNLRHVHRFLVPVELDGNNHILKLTAKEFEDGMAEVTDVSLYDMKYTKKIVRPPLPEQSQLNGTSRWNHRQRRHC